MTRERATKGMTEDGGLTETKEKEGGYIRFLGLGEEREREKESSQEYKSHVRVRFLFSSHHL
jgi:hypothetical protein